MTAFEGLLIWSAVGLYSLAFILFLGGLLFKKDNLQGYAYWITVGGFLLQSAGIADRWIETGHFPVMQTYENSLTGTWFMVITYLIMRYYFPLSKPFGVAVLPLTILILGNGIQTGAVLQPLEPPYRSNWLYIHVLFAWFSFSAYVIAFASGILYLLKSSGSKGVLSRLPDLKLLDELSLRLILFGFFTEAIMIGSGAIWAYGLWGRYWGWDPVETWSLISWLMYGITLHLRITLGWRERRAAWLSIISLFGVAFLFFGIRYLSSVHTGIF